MADIIVPILNCEKCKVEGMSLDPLNQANAFDEKAYDLLKALRIQGMPSVLALIQGIDAFSGAIKQKVTNNYNKMNLRSSICLQGLLLQNSQTMKSAFSLKKRAPAICS